MRFHHFIWVVSKQKIYDQETKFEIATYFQELAREHAKSYADYIVGDLMFANPDKPNKVGINNVAEVESDIRELTGVSVDFSSYKYKRPKEPFEVNIDYLLELGFDGLK